MLKIGDKLLCKKTGKLYNIKKISYIIKDEYYIQMGDLISKWRFVLNKDNKITFHDLYIWDYFYTPQELRKLKLEKLMK